MRPEYDFSYKYVIVGDSGAGKSCLLLRFTDDTYTESYISSIGVDFKIRTLENFGNSGKNIRLQIWDTCGSQNNPFEYKHTRTGVRGVIVVYDCTDQISFGNVKQWIALIKEKCLDNPKIILIGTKCDLKSQKAVESSVAQEFATAMNIPFIETSAKNNINVDQAFTTLTDEVFKSHFEGFKDFVNSKDIIDVFLSDVEQLKAEIQKDCEGTITFSLDRKRIGYLALDALSKNIKEGAHAHRHGPAADFIKEEIEKIRANPQFLGFEGGWSNSVRDLFFKYTAPRQEESSCQLM